MHFIIRGVLIEALLTVSIGISQTTTHAPEQYSARPSYLTTGDAAAGRRAYLTLKCDTCHTIAGEPIGGIRTRLAGPQLGKSVALQSPGQIADSIVAPRHTLSKKGGPWQESHGSAMGDYARVMTVQQLMDLVAYLRSL